VTRGSRRGRAGLNRRAFLRGAVGAAVALPFLESLPERSAWAEGEEPVFGLFIGTANGVVQPKFFPDELGPLTQAGLAAAGKATSQLSAHADHLLFLKGIRWPMPGPSSCSHAQGSCQVLTGRVPGGTGSNSTSTGPSADVVIASKVTPGMEPLNVYAGNRRNGYIAERLSFSGPGVVRAAIDNPYTLYAQLVGLADPGGGAMNPANETAARLLLESRKSIHDLVREDLQGLMRNSRLSSMDTQRLQQHFDAIRDLEVEIGGMAGDAMEHCNTLGLELDALEALSSGFTYKRDGMIEDMARLHMSLVALAFACNQSRVAVLQWGDGTDSTIYGVPANAGLGWSFHHISHRVQSDSQTGTNDVAETAHAEIDDLRMKTFAAGLDQFAARGLADRSFVLWTNHIADGPSHTYRNIPTILWGSANGYLKQAEYLDVGETKNSCLLTTLINAAILDTGAVVDDFGEDPTALDAIRV
jgi:hypothetical protein